MIYMMCDYAKGKIYRVYSPLCVEEYIGSTICKLKKRFSCHKSYSAGRCHGPGTLYAKMRELGKDNFEIELIENFPCSGRIQLETREFEIMNQRDAKLNKIRTVTSRKPLCQKTGPKMPYYGKHIRHNISIRKACNQNMAYISRNLCIPYVHTKRLVKGQL